MSARPLARNPYVHLFCHYAWADNAQLPSAHSRQFPARRAPACQCVYRYSRDLRCAAAVVLQLPPMLVGSDPRNVVIWRPVIVRPVAISTQLIYSYLRATYGPWPMACCEQHMGAGHTATITNK